MADRATRRHVLAGRSTAANGVTISLSPDAARISLRAPSASVAALSKALGVTLPKKPKTTARAKSGRLAAWLGPDEWIVIDESGKHPMSDCATVKAFHSAVDISHRNIAIDVSGPHAAFVVNGGCPQDLSVQAFPVGAASRTVLGKAEIILIRQAEDRFRIECWRSFAGYVFTLLGESARAVSAD